MPVRTRKLPAARCPAAHPRLSSPPDASFGRGGRLPREKRGGRPGLLTKGFRPMPRLPAGKFFLVDHVDESPKSGEQFTLDGPAGEVCLPVFTNEGLAESFMRALAGNEWEIFSVSR